MEGFSSEGIFGLGSGALAALVLMLILGGARYSATREKGGWGWAVNWRRLDKIVAMKVSVGLGYRVTV